METGSLRISDIRPDFIYMMEQAVKAPSGHNTQPWLFRVQKDRILRMDQILEVQELGNPEVNSIIEQAIGYLGIALANVVNLINPGYVVADSCLFQSEKNRKQLLESAKSNFFGLNEEEVQIEFAPFEKFRGAKGAAYFLIREKFLNI